MTIQLDSIYVLIDTNNNTIYPKLFLDKTQAEEFAINLNLKVIPNCFIKDNLEIK